MSKTSPTGGRCRSCPFFSGEVPEDVCTRCSRSLGPRAVVAVGVLLLSYWLAGHTLEYFLGGTFSYWRPGHSLALPDDYEFPVSLAAYPLYGIALGILYGIIATVPPLAACLGGLWLGVALAVVAGVAVPHSWYAVVLLVGAVVAGGSWGGPRWWWRRLLLAVAVPVTAVVAVHVASVVRTHSAVHLLPAAAALAVSVVLVGSWRREVRWRSLRRAPVVLVTLLLLVSAPLVFSFTVTFPYHRYRILWGRDPAPAGLLGHEGGLMPDAIARQGEQEAARFAEFARRYPGSPFAAEALYQQARLLNLVRRTADDGSLSISGGPALTSAEGRISAEALPVYERLITAYPQSVAAARARLDRAQWSLQNVRFEEVLQRYREVLITYETHIPPDYRPQPELILAGVCRQAGTGRTFTPVEKQVAYYEAYLTACEALAFLAANSQFGAEPLRLFCRFDPRAGDHRRRLEELLLLYPEEVYPELGLFDDLHLTLARGLPDEADRLADLLVRYDDGDARGRTLYRLAELAFDRGEVTGAERHLHELSGGLEESPAGLEAEWARALLEQGLADLAQWPHPFPRASP